MILFRAINKLDLDNYNSNNNIYCSLYNSYNKKTSKNSRYMYDYYIACLLKERKNALDCMVGHVSGSRLINNVSPWISLTSDIDFAMSEYAIVQAGNYNFSYNRKNIIIVDIPDSKILSSNEDVKLLRKSLNDDFVIDLRNNNLSRLFNNSILAEKYNEDLPGYILADDMNRLYGTKTRINTFSNYATGANELLAFKQIRKEYIKNIINPLNQDIIYSTNIKDINLINDIIKNDYKLNSEFFSELYPNNNLTDYLFNNYESVKGNNLVEKYNNLKVKKLKMLKRIIAKINNDLNTTLNVSRLVDDNILVVNYDDIIKLSDRAINDVILIEKNGKIYNYDNDTNSYLSSNDSIDSKEIKKIRKI